MAGRDIVMLSDGGPTRTFLLRGRRGGGLLQGAGARPASGEPYNVGVEPPEISMKDLPDASWRRRGTLFDYRGKVVTGASRRERLTW